MRSVGLTHSLSAARIGFDESMRLQRRIQRAQRLAAGKPLWELLAGPPLKQRTIYTAKNGTNTPGAPVRREGDPPFGDPEVDEAYDYTGATWDFYWNVFNRNSVDDNGAPLHGSVHYSTNYDNAFWDGQQMIYGDGDGMQFVRFTKSLDVIGHELTHGVTQHEAGLIYWGQTGALNESISDVFGSMVKQYNFNQTAQQADWLVGQGLFTSTVKGVAIRSLKAPGTAYGYPVPDPVLGKDDQPSHMKDYVHTVQDNGGVHINSGIPNNAFYRAATYIGGYSWEKVGSVWYGALTSPQLHKLAQFQTFASLTVTIAQQLFPSANSIEPQAIRQAWGDVGISV